MPLSGDAAEKFNMHAQRHFYRAALNVSRSSEEKAVRLSVRPSVCQTRAL